jgi:hypothetical protein
MPYKQTSAPSLPCPYCLEVHNNDPHAALWLGPNGGDPDTAKSEIELHMAECDRRNDPVTRGFVEASELLGETNAAFGIESSKDRTNEPREIHPVNN